MKEKIQEKEYECDICGCTERAIRFFGLDGIARYCLEHAEEFENTTLLRRFK